MREIKFRAWDEEEERYFYSSDTEAEHFFEFKDGVLRGFAIRPPIPSNDPMEPPEPYCDDYPIEQFTGLCDKNGKGKEIYGGDIIGKFNGIKHEVVWREEIGQWWTRFYNTSAKGRWNEELYKIANDNYIKIIGNVHSEAEDV